MSAEPAQAAEAMATRFREAGILAEAGPGGTVIITASDVEAAAILAYLGDILVNIAEQREVAANWEDGS
jgi:hypothetical protein